MKVTTLIKSYMTSPYGSHHTHRIVLGTCALMVSHIVHDSPCNVQYTLTYHSPKRKFAVEKIDSTEILAYTDEELFQKSLVQEHPMDLYLLKAIIVEYKNKGMPEYNGDQEWNRVWEY